MSRRFLLLLYVSLLPLLPAHLDARNLDTKGKAWLDSKGKEPPTDVSGTWHAKDWGRVVLNQSAGSRDVTGKGDGWDITGVVSGMHVFLLFSSRGTVVYSAELTSDGGSALSGSYTKGFMDVGSKLRPMHLAKEM